MPAHLTGLPRPAALLQLCVMLLLAMLSAARAAPLVTPGEMRSGALLLRGETPGQFVEAPRLGTDIDVVVSGPTLRTRVTQRFRNPTDGWVEAVYVHPLPEDAAVDALRMVVGERVIVGEIDRREAARQTYERARAAGQAASLLEQERPNLFTTSVANIGPGETVVVQIEFQGEARLVAGTASLRIPLVVGPRYLPAGGAMTVGLGGEPVANRVPADPVPDRARLASPVRDPRLPVAAEAANPVTLTVRLNAGFPLGGVASPTHRITEEVLAPDARLVRLADPVPADRDFELRWTPVSAAAPAVGLFRERVGAEDFILVSITPPAPRPAETRAGREVVYVIDNSGSMGGPSMAQARAGLLFALGRLTPRDRFNVIRFDDTMDMLFPTAQPADAGRVAKARAFVSALEARGGTEMLPPLRAALADPAGPEAPGLRQIVFLTDGAVGNERQLFETIAAGRGRSRLFMVGIGSAPNGHLMGRAAELGRGSYVRIGDVAEVEARMRELAGRLENPAMTGLAATFSAGAADLAPALLPDLYQDEPLVLVARVASLEGEVTLTGTRDGQPWRVRLPLAGATPGQGLSKLWARRRIADAEVAIHLGSLTREAAETRILELAMAHGLVTRLTSLVAVDRTPRRPAGTPLTRAEVPLLLPAGWDFDLVFGRAAGLLLPAAAAGVKAAGAAVPEAETAPAEELALPQTATDAELRLLAGLLLGGLALLLAPRRRRVA